jgi:hypothetical protein
MLGTQDLRAGRDLYRATPAVTRYLSFSGLIRRTVLINHLLRHTRGRGESILTRILTGHIGDGEDLFYVGETLTSFDRKKYFKHNRQKD